MGDEMDIKLSNDMIEGAEAIAEELGFPVRRAFNLLERGVIPGYKLGSRWRARRSTLRAFVEKLDGGA